jgi:excinuclease ABC subunit C
MVSHVDHFDFIIVHTDKEAFILEMNLIQTYYPRYNIMLMDDSHYPYIAVKAGRCLSQNRPKGQRFPLLLFRPVPERLGCLQDHRPPEFDLSDPEMPDHPEKSLPLLSMGQCLGPCINKIEPDVYAIFTTTSNPS